MAFKNTNNNNNDRKTTNTRGIQLYNSDETYGSTIVLDYWESFANIKIHPLLPAMKRQGREKFDYDSSVGLLLPVEKIYDLFEAWKYVAAELLQGNYDFDSVSVATVKADSMIQISPVSKKFGIEGGEAVCITIYNNISSNNTTETELTFVLTKSTFIKNYSAKDGSYDKSEPYESQFMLFGKWLEKSIDAMMMAYTHALNKANSYLNEVVIKESLYQLKQKAGITSGGYQNNNGGGYNNNNQQQQLPTQSFNATFGAGNAPIIDGGTIIGDRLEI